MLSGVVSLVLPFPVLGLLPRIEGVLDVLRHLGRVLRVLGMRLPRPDRGQRHRLGDPPIHLPGSAFGFRQPLVVPGGSHRHGRVVAHPPERRRIRRQEGVDVGAPTLGVAAERRVALTQRHGYHVPSHPRIRIGRCGDGSRRRADLQHIPFGDPQLRRRLGMDFHPGTPGDLRDRIGKLLEPRSIRPAPVVQHGRGIRDQREPALRTGPHRRLPAASNRRG